MKAPNTTAKDAPRVIERGGVEYVTKDEATARCRAFVATNPALYHFANHAHSKCVWRNATAEEKARMHGRLGVDVYEWNKVYTDAHALTLYPELRGYWKQRTAHLAPAVPPEGQGTK